MANAQRMLRALCHELSALVDGAMRYIELARREMSVGPHDQAAVFLSSAGAALLEASSLLRGAVAASGDRRVSMSRLASMRPVVEAVEHAVNLARAAAEPRGIEIRLRVDPAFRALPSAPIFPVVSNALRNALEMTPRGGTIEVRGRVERPAGVSGPRAVLEVLDDGPGPSRDAEEHAFELGFSTRTTGLGVGLALTRSIIDDLGGQVRLMSRVSIDNRRGGALVAWWPAAQEASIGGGERTHGDRAA